MGDCHSLSFLRMVKLKIISFPMNLSQTLRSDQSSEFRNADLPFTARISQYNKNCRALPKGPMFEVDVPVIDGYFLRGLPPEKEGERNVPGMVLTTC